MTGGTIYIVDDDAAVCESTEALVSALGHPTAAFTSSAEFLARFDPAGAACVLLDVRMPGMDGLALLEALGRRPASVPVIMVTGHGDVPMAVRAMRAGAADFVEKPFAPDRLLGSIERAVAQAQAAPAQPPAPPAPGDPVGDPALGGRFALLTPREADVMRQLVIGHPNKVIAHNLGMSPRTVEIHRGRVMEKTGAESLSHLVRMAIRAGFDPDAEPARGGAAGG